MDTGHKYLYPLSPFIILGVSRVVRILFFFFYYRTDRSLITSLCTDYV